MPSYLYFDYFDAFFKILFDPVKIIFLRRGLPSIREYRRNASEGVKKSSRWLKRKGRVDWRSFGPACA